MRPNGVLLLVVAVCATSPLPVTAQPVILIPSYGYSSSEFGYSLHRGSGVRLSATFIASPYALRPYGYSSVTRITVITIAPPPVFVRRIPRDFAPRETVSRDLDDLPGELPNLPVPRIRHGERKPDLPAGAKQDETPAVPPAAPRVPVPPVAPPPRIPPPSDDPVKEFPRQVLLGRDAFKAESYGLATQRFREASRLRPDEPMPYFLLAQTLIAMGKYHLAYDAILAGMDKQSDWPKARFRPIDLYGDAIAEYPEHLLRLENVLKKYPDDTVLLFLNAYQVWFAGRKAEAGPLFKRALKRLTTKAGTQRERKACERFLRELPPGV